MSAPNIPSVMNGEGCPGCKTPIWGMRPKKCFMCGYDFENPDPNQTYEARVAAEEQRLREAVDETYANIDTQREQEKVVRAELDRMIEEFLRTDWPEDWTLEDIARTFEQAVQTKWPLATFHGLEVEMTIDHTKQELTKRIYGSMDRADLRIVGFQIKGEKTVYHS